jgi:DNA-binding transcriptional ArsR family regulator
MTDIFSDTMFTAPQRQSNAAITGFIAYTAAEVEAMAQNMREVAEAENAAMRDRMGHHPSSYDKARMPQRAVAKHNEDKVLTALAQLGPSTANEIARAVSLDRSTVSARLKMLFEHKAINRDRMSVPGTCYLYSVAQTKQAASSGENLGVHGYPSEVQA